MAYTTFRNKLTCIIRRVKALYYAKLFLENSSDPKKIWDILNGLINNGSKTVLEEIIVNNTTLKGIRMVNYINYFFINIALNIRNEPSFTTISVSGSNYSSIVFLPANQYC